MEYISPWEQEYIKLASSITDIENRLKSLAQSREDAQLLRAKVNELETVYQSRQNVDAEINSLIANWMYLLKLPCCVEIMSEQ